MAFEILTPDEMAKADRLTIESGLVDGIGLMRRAGQAVAAVILERFPEAAGVAVLAGPGNNGGDGYVIADELRRAGVDVTLWRAEPPRAGTDAAIAAAECTVSRARSPNSRPSRAGWSSMRCSAPGWPARWTASTPRRSASSMRPARASSPSTCRAASPA